MNEKELILLEALREIAKPDNNLMFSSNPEIRSMEWQRYCLNKVRIAMEALSKYGN